MSEGFIMLRRTPETFELLRDTNAFILLTVIALRAGTGNADPVPIPRRLSCKEASCS